MSAQPSRERAALIAVAADLLRRKWSEDVPVALADQMTFWAMRIKAVADDS